MNYKPYVHQPESSPALRVEFTGETEPRHFPIHVAEIILDAIRNLKLTGTVEGYFQASRQNAGVFAVSFAPVQETPPLNWQEQLSSEIQRICTAPATVRLSKKGDCSETLGNIRADLLPQGAIRFNAGIPISIVDFYPDSAFIYGTETRFSDLNKFLFHLLFLSRPKLTKSLFMSLPEGAFLMSNSASYSCVLGPPEQRTREWSAVPKEKRQLLCMVYRNRRHYDTFMAYASKSSDSK